MKKGTYIREGMGKKFIVKGTRMRMISITVTNECKKRVHIKGDDYEKLKKLAEKINTYNL